MPLILAEGTEDLWLETIDNETDKVEIIKLIQSYPDDELACHTVAKLRGKAYQGNVEHIDEEVNYPELEFAV